MPLTTSDAPAENAGLTLAPGKHLPDREGHRVWWSQGGDASSEALPVLMVHGGPGGQSRAEPLAWWQGLPVRWIAIDQRGCGRSLPAGETGANTLDSLLLDMERLREHLGLARWALAGGSWGAVVALAYTLRHPERVAGLHLRSPFLGSDGEVERYLHPWESWLGEPGLAAFGADAKGLRRMFQPATGPRQAETGLTRSAEAPEFADEARLAQAWSRFDDGQSQPGGVVAGGSRWAAESVPRELPASWRVFRHYASHGWFLPTPLLTNLQSLGEPLRTLPLSLVHGALDACCDPATSRALAEWHGAAEIVEVAGGGHRMGPPPMATALRDSARAWVMRTARHVRGTPLAVW